MSARRSTRLFRALLRLLPRDFRGDFGDEMTADFEDRRHDAPSPAALWRRELPALVATAIRQHLDVLARDVRHALRLMRRTPGFTALAVLMLALGTGANVAVFSVIDGVMLRSPFPDPDRIVIMRVVDAQGRFTAAVPVERYFELQAASGGPLAAVGAVGGGSHVLSTAEGRRRIDLQCVSASLFDVLGTHPRLGRTLQPGDDRPGAAPVVVLSHDLWRELGASPGVVGTTITLNTRPVTVVGVMPSGFAGPYSRSDERGWLPMNVSVAGAGLDGCTAGASVNVFARVRAELTVPGAQAALPGLQLVPLSDSTFEEVRTPFLVLTAAVACVLLIGCLNVGGLQLERALARRDEMGLRMALGASRSRLIRQTMTESLVLAVTGAAAGIALAFATLGSLVALLPSNLPHLDQVALNGRALAVGLAVAGAAGLIAGSIPILQRSRAPAGASGAGGRPITRRVDWTRRALIVTQIGLSIVVLIGAGLMIQTFLILRPASPGFDPHHKLMTLVRRPGIGPDESVRFFDRLFDRVEAIPGVRAAAGSSYFPMSGTVATRPVRHQNDAPTAWSAVVTPGYFELMKIPLVAGRTFAAADTAGAERVAIVNEVLARRLRGDGAVIGDRVGMRLPRGGGPEELEWTIVGIIANTRSLGSDTRARHEIYVPFAQNGTSTLHVIVEAAPGQDAAIAAGIRQALREIDPTLVIEPIDSLIARLYDRVEDPRLGAWLLGIFAAISMALAAIGLLTTIGWWVRQRTRELGVRMALGATSAQIARLVMRQGLTVSIAGIVVGWLGAFWATRFLDGWIYGVAPFDRPTFAIAALLMLLAAVAAIWLPMRLAVRVDPVTALRVDA